MPLLLDLLAQHKIVHAQYAKLFAASRGLAKKLEKAKNARSLIRRAIHTEVGTLAPGTLVMTITGTRFYEISTVTASRAYFHAVPVYQHTGECKKAGKWRPFAYYTIQVVEWGSVLPVPREHPVYLKWEKRRFRDKLEGKA